MNDAKCDMSPMKRKEFIIVIEPKLPQAGQESGLTPMLNVWHNIHSGRLLCSVAGGPRKFLPTRCTRSGSRTRITTQPGSALAHDRQIL
jgi:hypothetical protein